MSQARPAEAPSEQTLVHSQGRLIRRSVKWTAIGMAASKSLSMLAKLVLARLLVPEYFGFVAMVLVFTQIAKIVGDVGLTHAMVQRKRDGGTRLLFDSAFWFLMLVAITMIGLMWLIGVPFIVWFYDEPALATIAMAMSFGILFQNLKVVPEARLVRTMRFKRIAISELFGTVVGCIAAIALAMMGAGVWSLVGQVLIVAICTMAALFISAGWTPRFRFSLSALLGVKEFSSYILGSRAFVYLQQNLDYLLIGKLMGAYAVGIYASRFWSRRLCGRRSTGSSARSYFRSTAACWVRQRASGRYISAPSAI
jgi:O-antigen/teichoic acid export membrane protein